ncbi:hypothetical protein AMECASPLE_014727 [Ameca splendens]|uniref:Uncharacterized protein n=1 Tax=Ameca splendens TaxID=208324 RepID=A0ABV1AAM2_9TELE
MLSHKPLILSCFPPFSLLLSPILPPFSCLFKPNFIGWQTFVLIQPVTSSLWRQGGTCNSNNEAHKRKQHFNLTKYNVSLWMYSLVLCVAPITPEIFFCSLFCR